MRYTVSKALFIGALAMSASAAFALDGIPVVPADVMRAASQKKPQPVEAGTKASATAVEPASAPSELVMTPGYNQLVPIAISHVNRIVTPFSNPEVTSTTLTLEKDGGCGEVCIKDNVVYLATDREGPTSLFITEKGSQAMALSLTLVPRQIPPREIFLKLEGGSIASATMANKKAQRWEENQPYIETIRSVFRELALGNTPQGYTMNHTPETIRLPRCEHPGLRVGFVNGQLFQGHHLTVFVGIATNESDAPVEFKEAHCGDWDVAGVAVWPRNVLHPGEKTEVFVARKQMQTTAPTSRRTSLLEGQ